MPVWADPNRGTRGNPARWAMPRHVGIRTPQRVQEAATILPEAIVGPFVTVQECSGSDELGVERGRRFEALCENMEGAAAAHLCACYGIPLVEVRAMSNIVEKRDRKKWDLPLAVERAQSAALKLLEHKL